ncbi:MAG: hypothetical protein KDC46_03745 [Thermoleophilia bacterium]|nr:hypothetical protein [Thermoleophilia bacterium]
MCATRRQPTDAELVELHDRLWNDPRRRDDRSEFHECDACGRAVRWIANLGSAIGSSLPIVARPVATAATFDTVAHAGFVAVYVDRTGFTIPRGTSRDELDDAFVYRCHWDVCEHARRTRDRLSSARDRAFEASPDPESADPDAVRRYIAWRESRRDV